MDFSAWDWAKQFRLHEAACLIAGVMPVTKKTPSTEDLPPQARPILIVLASAYYEWLLQQQNPQRTKTQVLEGCPLEDGSLPPFPSLQAVVGELISREAIHRFLSDTGRKSVYVFQPIAHTTSVLDGKSNTQTDEFTPQTALESAGATPANEPRPTATGPRLAMIRAALIAQHQHEWPTVAQDIKDAKRNGLSDVAKADTRGWYEPEAMAWARANNRLQNSPTKKVTTVASTMPTLENLPSHRIKGC